MTEKKFYRRYIDETEPEEITERAFCERFKDDFKNPERFLAFLQESASREKPFQYGAAEYWFEEPAEAVPC